MQAKLFDCALVSDPDQAVDFIRKKGARRLSGYEPEEVVGKAKSSILPTPEDGKAGRHPEIMEIAPRWEN